MPFAVRWVGVEGLLLATLALWAAASPAALRAQQPLELEGERGLIFGTVFPGVPKAVSRLDPANSGQFSVVAGQAGAEVLFTFTLPSTLLAAGGQTLTVEFGLNDGGFAQTNVQSSSVGFDPRVPYTNRLHPANGRAFVWLGGTARPVSTQAAGLYQATVTLTVAYTGA